MIRKRILLVSLLKPVSDTRLYEKIGQSLAKLPDTEVHVAGYIAPIPPAAENTGITFHPVFHFKRLSLGRILAQGRFWKLLNQVRPHLLIIGTHELLPLSALYCRLHACKLVYDVQENYYLNLTTQQVYPGLIAKIAGNLVRFMEKMLAPAIAHFFLAEQAYARELPFLGQRYTVLQNKYLPAVTNPAAKRSLPVALTQHRPLRLLYSGTISRLYGVWEAIEFTSRLRNWVPDVQLTIIGYCAEAAYLTELRAQIKDLSFVTLLGGDALVPHHEILAQEQRHHLGLLPYRPHPSTFTCLPTKLFEYLANGLVVVTEENPLWEEILRQTNGGLTHAFAQELTAEKVEQLLRRTYYQKGIPADVFWKEEAQHAQQVVRQLLDQSFTC
ncbi:glycosyltransferase [Rufibacter immobilis]|uniref:glycosyltransferase n=1 Tax=Rufibacter immobilis TaxID=1348778 RepID=UPI0035E8DA4E